MSDEKQSKFPVTKTISTRDIMDSFDLTVALTSQYASRQTCTRYDEVLGETFFSIPRGSNDNNCK